MFANSLKDLPSNTLNGIVAASSSVHVVLLSFSRQSKVGPENASDQSATHPQDRLSRIHSLLLPITEDDEPQSEVNIEEELRSDYVKGYRKIYDERKVPEEKLVAAIKYLNRLKGGIKAQRSIFKLIFAIEHMDIMRSRNRMDDSGFPLEYSPEELLLILVDSGKYRFKDVLRVLKNHLKTNSFLPSPVEFVELYKEMKVQLEEEVAEKTQALEETRQEVEEKTQALDRTQIVVEEKTQALEEKNQALNRTQIVVEEKTQALEEKNQALNRTQIVVEEKTQALEEKNQALDRTQIVVEEKNQALEETEQEMEKRTQKLVASRRKIRSLKESLRQQQQQHQEVLQQKDRIIQQAMQRVRELELNPEGEHQRRYSESSEICRLSAQAQRSLCKVCLDEEVQVVFLPCKHMVTCEGCVSTLHWGKCPICKQNIQNKIKVSLA
ncbi:uncharacterized protein LOC111110400 isoform X2 [Crassostrea virginica]